MLLSEFSNTHWGQESGHKTDPEKVSRDMRYARRDNGERRFDVE